MNAVETARALGLNERTVRRALASGRLTAVRNGRSWEIDPAEARSVFGPSQTTASVYRDALAEALFLLRAFGHEGYAEGLEREYGLKYVEPRPAVLLAVPSDG